MRCVFSFVKSPECFLVSSLAVWFVFFVARMRDVLCSLTVFVFRVQALEEDVKLNLFEDLGHNFKARDRAVCLCCVFGCLSCVLVFVLRLRNCSHSCVMPLVLVFLRHCYRCGSASLVRVSCSCLFVFFESYFLVRPAYVLWSSSNRHRLFHWLVCRNCLHSNIFPLAM